MYYVVDTAKQTPFTDKQQALIAVAEGSTQQVLMNIGNHSDETLELLYGLAVEMLKVSGLNPHKLEIQLQRIDNMDTITAAQIITDARYWLDNLNETRQ